MRDFYGQSKSPGWGGLSGYSWDTAAAAERRRRGEGDDKNAFNYAYWNNAPEYQAYSQSVANQNQILGNANQRLSEVRSDPLDALIRGELTKQLDTKGFEDVLRTQGSDMAASAGSARQQQMDLNAARLGQNLGDPSSQAGRLANLSQVQQQQQTAALNATLGARQAGQGAAAQAGQYQANRANQLNTATNMANQALSMPVQVAPRGRQLDTGAASGAGTAAARQPQSAGYSLGPTSSSDAYQQWLKKSNQNRI